MCYKREENEIDLEGQMNKFLLAILFSVFSNICVEASQEQDVVQASNRVISIEEVRKAEESLNESRPFNRHGDIMAIFKYLESQGWGYKDIAQKYSIEEISVKKFLDNDLCYGTMLDCVHRYYVQGGESVIGVLPPHKQQTNWVDSMMSWFCGHHDPQEHHQQKIIKTQ